MTRHRSELKLHPDPDRRDHILRSIANTEYLNIWEGSIRSGKTLSMLVAWLVYMEETEETQFIISGRTLATVEKNLINGDYGLRGLAPESEYKMVGQSKALIIYTSKGPKTCYCMGASDIKSYQALRGFTAGGWMADEINMHQRDFVLECLNRTALSTDRRILWTLNPDNPQHWIYTDPSYGIDRYTAMSKEEKRAVGGVHYWHFTPRDNPVMTEERLKQLELQYTGFAYKRYILGLRCASEGLIYPFIDSTHFADFRREEVQCRYASIDFGTNHPTVMYIGGPFRGFRDDWRICYEYYDEKSGKDTRDYAQDLIDLCERNGVNPYKLIIAIDPSARALKNSFIKAKLTVMDADNSVLDGINTTYRVLNKHKLTLHRSCVHAKREFGIYSWDEKASERGEDKPIKINDDCMDSLRYFVMSHMKYMEKGL